jgi:hypothetical protein
MQSFAGRGEGEDMGCLYLMMPADLVDRVVARETCFHAWGCWKAQGGMERRRNTKRRGRKHQNYPSGWGTVWIDKGCRVLEGTLAEPLWTVVNFIKEMEMRCAQWQVRHVGTCKLHCVHCPMNIGQCTQCRQAEEKSQVCSVQMRSAAIPAEVDEEQHARISNVKKKWEAEAIRSINMHQLGKRFVQGVPEMRHRRRQDCNPRRVAGIPGANMGVSVAESEAFDKAEKGSMLQMNDIGLQVALEWTVGTDIWQ